MSEPSVLRVRKMARTGQKAWNIRLLRHRTRMHPEATRRRRPEHACERTRTTRTVAQRRPRDGDPAAGGSPCPPAHPASVSANVNVNVNNFVMPVSVWEPANPGGCNVGPTKCPHTCQISVGRWALGLGRRDLETRSSSGHLIMIDGTEDRWGRCPRYRYRCAGGSLSAQRQGQVHGRETRDGGGGGEGSTEASKPAEEGCGRHSNLSLDMEWTRD